MPKRKLRKDILYRLGLEEGKKEGEIIGIEKGRKIGHEEGFIKALQDTVLTLIRGKLGQVPEGVEVKIRGVRDREYF